MNIFLPTVLLKRNACVKSTSKLGGERVGLQIESYYSDYPIVSFASPKFKPVLSQNTAFALIQLCSQYGEEEVKKAIDIAVECNTVSLTYIKGVLTVGRDNPVP